MTTSSSDKRYPIPAALPAILKGFARETLRAQPQDIYKFAAQYFKELNASSAVQTQPGVVEDQAANLQANLLQHFLDVDRSNGGLLHRDALKQALCARGLALSSRTIMHITQSWFKDNEPNLSQDFKACLQSHELALCRKDVNVVLGEVEDGPIEYQTLAESVYQVLATRLENELLLNENLASSKALSQHLVQMLQQQDSQRMGSISLARLVQTLRTLSQDCLGLTIICLACIIGCTASDTTDSVPYKQWAGPAAAMMYSMLDPKIASARHAALTEFRGRDESERNRSVNVQSTKDCLLQAYQESDQSGSGHLTKQKCKLVIKGPASDLLHLSPQASCPESYNTARLQESVALQSVVEGNASDKIACDDFVGQCSQVLVQLEEEEYMFHCDKPGYEPESTPAEPVGKSPGRFTLRPREHTAKARLGGIQLMPIARALHTTACALGCQQALHVAQAGSGLQQCTGQALLTLLHLLHQLGICLSSSIAHGLLQLFFLHSKQNGDMLVKTMVQTQREVNVHQVQGDSGRWASVTESVERPAEERGSSVHVGAIPQHDNRGNEHVHHEVRLGIQRTAPGDASGQFGTM
ncbi:MAG: hypothetical protein FRX49_12539 [Trebouxia sp. A1-2]|nr:MAG: hypothetical protein FRX49_12539 [Trebouxia sp. A1-2]